VKLLATDLDGTLLRSDGTVSDRTREALVAAKESGLLVVFVTGRPPRWLDEAVDQTGHVGVAVGANGAVIYDCETATITESHPMRPQLLADITGELREAFPKVSFGFEYGDGFGAEPTYVHDWQINPRVDRAGRPIPPPRLGSVDELITKPALKLLAKDRDAAVDDFLAAAELLVGSRASLTHSSSVGLLELAAFGITKASGLAHIAREHDIGPDEIVAVGDMPNDIPMLRWAGTSYAVGNAHPAARAAAGGVIGTNDEDAVARLIESLLALS
jgi:Cof subfamily protein (haloacid dehalogenase superfamily)